MYKTCCFTVYYNLCKTFTSSENRNVNLPKQKCKAYSSGIQRDQGFCLEKPQNKGSQWWWASWAVWRRGRHFRTVSVGMYVDHIASLPPHQRVNSRASLEKKAGSPTSTIFYFCYLQDFWFKGRKKWSDFQRDLVFMTWKIFTGIL